MTISYLILIIGLCASAVSFVFIRESTEPPVMLASYRVLFAAILLVPVYWRDLKRFGDAPFKDILKRSWIPGLVLGFHFIAWVIGARMTPGANANLIVTLMPVVMPFFMLLMFDERIQRRELIATCIAVVGMLLLTIDDFHVSRDYFMGDLICFISMLLFAWYLALARKNRSVASVWLYIVPVYFIAGISTLIIAMFFSSPIHHYTAYNALMIFLLAAVSTVIGHSALNYAMQKLRGQTVTIINMAQFIVAGIFGYWIYNEIPTLGFYLASALLLFAMWLIISGKSAAIDTPPAE